MSETQAKYKRIGGGDYWPKDSDQGTSLLGILKGRTEEAGKFGSQVVLHIETPDGGVKLVSVTAGLKRANDQMSEGKAYRITYTGRQQGKGPLPFKRFEVDLIEGYKADEVVPF